MNFLNDSLKTLKNVLAEGLDQQVNFDGLSSDPGGTEGEGTAAYQERENLMKLCQHQSSEVCVVPQWEKLVLKSFRIALFSSCRHRFPHDTTLQ